MKQFKGCFIHEDKNYFNNFEGKIDRGRLLEGILTEKRQNDKVELAG